MTDPHSLHLDRVVTAPQAQVWEAWTTEDGLRSWWWRHLPDTTCAIDLRVGGAYRIEAPSQGIGVTGEYLVIEEPHRLEMTWVWLEHGQRGDVEEVAVTFIAEDDPELTRIVIDHTGPWTSAEPADNYLLGWNFTLDQLRTTLTDASAPESSE